MFKKGDKVICINANNRSLLNYNSIYIVSDVYDNLITLEDTSFATYFASRFVSAEIFIKQQEFEKKLKTILKE